MSLQTPAHSHPSIDNNKHEESHNCRRCDLPISEGHAYELGDDRWHTHCFSCSKCSTLLGTSSNFLVLGTGELVCCDCSYACNSCGKKIDDLAILTGDQTYCSSCFCCRNCKKRIEDSRYAKTSKGLFCMSCHERLLEKKKKHEQEKKNRPSRKNSKIKKLDKSLPKVPNKQEKIPDGISTPNLTSTPNPASTPNSVFSDPSPVGILETITKAQTVTPNLKPVIPPRSPNRKKTTPSLNKTQQKVTLEPALVASPKKETLNPEVQSSFKFKHQPITVTLSYDDAKDISSDVNEFTESISTEFESEKSKDDSCSHEHIDYLRAKSPINNTEIGSPLRSSVSKTPNGSANRQVVVVDSTSPSSSNILSSYITYESPLPPPDMPPPDMPPPDMPPPNPSSPKLSGFKIELNYDEPNYSGDFIDLDTSDDDNKKPTVYKSQQKFNKMLDEYNNNTNDNDKQYNHEKDEAERSNYKEKLTGFSQSRKMESIPGGLNIQGLENNEEFHESNQDSFKTPTFDVRKNSARRLNSNQDGMLSPSSPSPSHSKKSEWLSFTNDTALTTSRTIRSPKAFLNNFRKHKKSESSSSIDYKISSPFMTSENIQYNNNCVSTPVDNPRASVDIIISPSQGAAPFSTPPFTDTRCRQGSVSSIQNNLHYHQYANTQHKRSISSGAQHMRSTSDAAMITLVPERRLSACSNTTSKADEAKQLELELKALKTEIRDLKQTKFTITKEINDLTELKESLSLEISSVSSKLNSLTFEEPITPIKSPTTIIPRHQNKKSVDIGENNKIDKNTIKASILSAEIPNIPIEPVATDTKQQKSRGKFWKRGNFFNKSEANGINVSYSSNSLNNFPNDGNGSSKGNPVISAPFIRTGELDELSANDTKKLFTSNSNQQNHKYLDVSNVNVGNLPSNPSQNNLTLNNNTSGLIISDLFNSTLESRAIFEKRSIPLIITRSIEEVEKRGLYCEGIYRKNGGTSQMSSILKAFNNLHHSDTSQELEKALGGDIAAVTSSLKRYLYHILPEPIISNGIYKEFISVPKLSTIGDKVQRLKQLLTQLPQTNTITLRLLLDHIKKIESHKDQNKMTYHNLAVVFGPTFTRVSSGERELLDMKPRNEVIEFMLSHSDDIF